MMIGGERLSLFFTVIKFQINDINGFESRTLIMSWIGALQTPNAFH